MDSLLSGNIAVKRGTPFYHGLTTYKRLIFFQHITLTVWLIVHIFFILDSVFLIVPRTLLLQTLAWAPTLTCQGKLNVMRVSWMGSRCIMEL